MQAVWNQRQYEGHLAQTVRLPPCYLFGHPWHYIDLVRLCASPTCLLGVAVLFSSVRLRWGSLRWPSCCVRLHLTRGAALTWLVRGIQAMEGWWPYK